MAAFPLADPYLLHRARKLPPSPFITMLYMLDSLEEGRVYNKIFAFLASLVKSPSPDLKRRVALVNVAFWLTLRKYLVKEEFPRAP